MIKKYIFGVFAFLLALTVFSTVALAAPEVVVTNNGLALLLGDTEVAPGGPVVIQIVPKDEGPLTPDGGINGYVNETVIQPDGSYKLFFSLEDIFAAGSEYDCHIDIAGEEYFLIPLIEGSLIEVEKKSFDRDTKKITVTGSLWDSSAYGINLTLTIDGFEKTVQSDDDGKFNFEFAMEEAGITTYGTCDFTIAYTDDASSYCEDSIEIVNAEPILESIRDNSANPVKLEEILTDTANLQILGFDAGVIYGDCELSELAGSEYFIKLSKTEIAANKVSELAKSIETAYTLYNMEENPSDINLRRCTALFGLAPDDEITLIYNNFNADTEPEYMFNLWSSKNFIYVSDAAAFYKDAVLLTKLNTSKAWSDLMVFVNDKHELLNIEERTAAEFWQNLIEMAPFSSCGDFKQKYDDTADKMNRIPPVAGGSSGGGGGSSGGGSGFSVGGGTSIPVTPQKPIQPQEPKQTFKDISSGHWASEAVTKLYEMGIISGKSEGTFAPNDLVTRAEVAKLMCTSAKIDGKENETGSFSDVDSKHWAIGYIEAAFESGLIAGRGNGNYGPEDCTTREDMAVFCYRLLKAINPDYKDEGYVRDDLTFADAEVIADYAVEAVAAMSELGIINGKGDNRFDPKAYCTRAEAAKIFYGVLQ